MPRRSSPSMRRAAGARSRSRRISWLAARATTCCSRISRARSIPIPIPAARWAQARRHELRLMRIGVTYDLRSEYLAMGLSEEETAEFDSEVTIAGICDALASLGYKPVRIGNVRQLTEALAKGDRWDGVFNFCEGLNGVSREAQAPALLEAYDIPYAFSDPLTLALTLDKAMAKRVVRDCGIPTADFAVIERAADIRNIDLPFPLFLKPVAEGSGKGVDAKSKVDNRAQLDRTARSLLARFRQPVLVETFLPGREFTVAILGPGEDARVLGVRW